jgi:hypothetical protein
VNHHDKMKPEESAFIMGMFCGGMFVILFTVMFIL